MSETESEKQRGKGRLKDILGERQKSKKDRQEKRKRHKNRRQRQRQRQRKRGGAQSMNYKLVDRNYFDN